MKSENDAHCQHSSAFLVVYCNVQYIPTCNLPFCIKRPPFPSLFSISQVFTHPLTHTHTHTVGRMPISPYRSYSRGRLSPIYNIVYTTSCAAAIIDRSRFLREFPFSCRMNACDNVVLVVSVSSTFAAPPILHSACPRPTRLD